MSTKIVLLLFILLVACNERKNVMTQAQCLAPLPIPGQGTHCNDQACTIYCQEAHGFTATGNCNSSWRPDAPCKCLWPC
ncbi:hypothetical protein CRG98_026433 [Punica granatum]|uniref:Uncharacterized protein n=1 Tax=Punica granatum TaxID=22663 RepID=A0A2I0JA86_PUNGR|nr:hypothetical protein CRG98_026433 [Punica granatum]